MKRPPTPPKWALRFFRWYCHPKLLYYIEGDLLELYQRRVRSSGRRIADLRFIIDVLFLARPGIIRPASGYQSVNTYGMYKNYFKTAFRNLWKNKGYSAINIFGLAMGMAVVLLIGLWVNYQLSYDRFNVNRDNIARVMKRTLFNNVKGTQTGVMLPLYDELKTNYPEVKRATRLDWGGTQGLMVGDMRIAKRGHYADPDLLKMFSFPMIKGDVDKALSDPYSIVVTESLAAILFEGQDPMGKVVTLNKSTDLIVTGVLKDIPPNSSISFDFVMPYELQILTKDWVKNARDNWNNNFLQTIVELNDGVTPEAFSLRIENLLREKTNNPEESTFFVHPLMKWQLYSRFENWVNTGGLIDLVRLFSIVGLLVLSIACINFVNLSTARSERRAREVGIRKAVGSHRGQLIGQFLGESMITVVLSFVIALSMVYLSLPLLEPIGFENITLDLTNIEFTGIAIGSCALLGILAGWYPALYLSGVKAVNVLKGKFRLGKSADLPRKVLIVTQFTFSIALIIGTIVVFLQIQHGRNRPRGYNPDNLMHIYLTQDLRDHFDVLKEQLLNTGYVDAVSRASSPMTSVHNSWDGFAWEGMDPTSKPVFSAIIVDHDYDLTSGLEIKAGRFFDTDHASDSGSVVISETTARLIGFDDPIGRMLTQGGTPLTIIGVTRDMVMQNPFSDVPPAVMFWWPGISPEQGFIRLRDGVPTSDAIAAIGPIVEKLNPAFPFDFRFTDQVFEQKFANEQKAGKLAGIFAGLSVLLSCLGLFGLASFMAERRTKEIGVRKVVGASIVNLWGMLSKDFVLLVLVACAIAMPTAYFLMGMWLETYPYRTDIPLWILAATGVGTLGITLAIVSYQTIKAARMNPVRSLRTE